MTGDEKEISKDYSLKKLSLRRVMTISLTVVGTNHYLRPREATLHQHQAGLTVLQIDRTHFKLLMSVNYTKSPPQVLIYPLLVSKRQL